MSHRARANGSRIAVLAIAAALAASTAASGSTTKRATTMTNVTIAVTYPVAEFFEGYLAQEIGAFAANGINPTFQSIGAGALLPSVVGGQAQFAISASPFPETGAVNTNGAVKWLGAWSRRTLGVILAAPGINSIKQLRGKRLGVTAPGGTSALLTNYMMGQAKVSPSNFSLLYLGNSANIAAAWQSGQLDASYTAAPQLQALEALRPGSKVIYTYPKLAWTDGGIFANMSWVRANRAATLGVLRAMNAGVKAWFSKPAMAEALIESKTGATPATALATYKSTTAVLLHQLSPILPATVKSVMTILHQNGVAGITAAQYAQAYNNSYLQAALKKK